MQKYVGIDFRLKYDRRTLKFPNHKLGNRLSFKVAFSTPIRWYFFLLKSDAKGTVEFSLLVLFFFSQYGDIHTIQPCSWQHKRSFWVLENALNNRSSGEPPKQLPTSSIDAATLRVWKEKAFHLSLSSLGIEPIYKIVNNNI